MKDIVNFITNHWVLCSLFVTVLVLLILNEVRNNLGSSQISAQEAVQRMNHQEAVVIDLRAANVFDEGHIVGAHNIPISLLEKKLNTLQKHLGKPIILFGGSQAETTEAVRVLQPKGFQILKLPGGLQAWRAASLPLTKK